MTTQQSGKRWVSAWLTVLLIAVIGLIGFWTKTPPDSTDNAESSQQPEVSRIIIEPDNQPALLFNRTDDGWRMVEPVHALANATRLDYLIQLRNEISTQAVLFNREDVEKGEIPIPDIKISIDNDIFYLGPKTESQQYRHVRHAGNDFLIENSWFGDLEIKPEEFLSTRLLPENAQIQKIELPDVSLTRKSNGAWRSKPRQEVSTGALAALVMNWQLAHAVSLKLGAENITNKNEVTIHYAPSLESLGLHLVIIKHNPQLQLYDPESEISYFFPQDIATGLLDLDLLNAEGETNLEPRI